MTKSKAKSFTLRSHQGDFRLQPKRHPSALHTFRVQSRSCSSVHPPSTTSTPPRTKVAFADFADFSSAARVSSKRKIEPCKRWIPLLLLFIVPLLVVIMVAHLAAPRQRPWQQTIIPGVELRLTLAIPIRV